MKEREMELLKGLRQTESPTRMRRKPPGPVQAGVHGVGSLGGLAESLQTLPSLLALH